MPTPNSPGTEMVDIHADPAFRDQFDAKVGEKALAKANVSEPVEPRARPCNVGRAEQQLRLAAGGLMLGTAVFAPLDRGWRLALGVFGAAQIVTGSLRYCPVWHALDVDTNRVRALR